LPPQDEASLRDADSPIFAPPYLNDLFEDKVKLNTLLFRRRNEDLARFSPRRFAEPPDRTNGRNVGSIVDRPCGREPVHFAVRRISYLRRDTLFVGNSIWIPH
jgi:hypothetical protein